MHQHFLVTKIIILLLLCLTGTLSWGANPTSLSLTTSVISPTAVGTRITLTATPNGPGAMEYQFKVKYVGPTGTYVWETLQSYGINNTCIWTPSEVHDYTIIAYARLQGTAISYLLYRDMLMSVKPVVTDIRVGTSLTSPTAVGAPVKLTVTGRTNGGTLEYNFRVKYQLPDLSYIWQTVQEYSSISSCTWTPTEAQNYLLYVYAREKGTSVSYTVFKEIPFTAKPAVSGLQLVSSITSPTGVGTPVKLTAIATGGATLEYKFYALYRDAAGLQQTELIKDYPATNIITWSPKLVTTYTSVVACVREKGKTVDYDQIKTIDNFVVKPVVTGLSLTALPKSPAFVNVPIALTTSATAGGTLEYQFKAKFISSPGVYTWQMLQEYSPLATCKWTPTEAYTYTVYAYAREKGTTTTYQVFAQVTFTVNTMSSVVINRITSDNAEVVWVPGATFTMGSPDGVGYANEYPAHQVTLSGYWIYKYDVTVAQYRAFCTATGHALPPWPGNQYSWTGKTGWDDATLKQHPIVNVTLDDARAYADWAGVKLPTEAQWEYAARGPQGNNFPWGGTATLADPTNGWDDTKCANYYNSYAVGKSTWPVGSFPAGASWCGAQDMAGNVWQWCSDWYSSSAATPVTNPAGPVTGDFRVLRGTAWDQLSVSCFRDTYRGYASPNTYSSGIGFRCASFSSAPVAMLPTITSLNPGSGPVGTVVTLTGTKIDTVMEVKFNGVIATFTALNATTVIANVPVGATTGPVTIITLDGTATSNTSFIVIPAPTITSFTPASGMLGTVVTLTGTDFTGATAVKFNNTAATTFSVVSATSITATVPAGTTNGKISVTTPGGTATSATNYSLPPTIASFTPASGPVDTVVTLTGTNFSGATVVKFNGTSVTNFSVVSNTSITATVPTGATSGTITVITPGGTATSATVFTFIPAPTITSFTPTSGLIGTVITLTGTNFTGATAVKFNGTAAATFNVVSATSITASVPAGATTGKISVTTPGGMATSAANLTVFPAPTITSFTPASGPVGTVVTLTGINFIGATAVKFNGIAATSFSVVSASSITATVPVGATTGTITITNIGGTGTSVTSFTVILAPTLISFTPASGSGGTVVTLTGTNFTWTTAVKFNGTAATNFNVVSATSITATVPTGTTTGTISVITPGGTATSATIFTIAPAPTLFSFTPARGPAGTVVTLTGTNFTGATMVKFNGTAATTLSVISATSIMANVPTGATSGRISVTTPGGTATSTANFTVIPAPTINSFTPTSGPVGTLVTLAGYNFANATAVIFNGTAATVFNVDSATTITAVVPTDATTGKITVTTPGGTYTTATNFSLPPIITSFTPTTGPGGAVVTLTGSSFTGATAIKFNGAAVTSFSVVSNTSITATVPTSATTGPITVTTPGGTTTSATNFTFNPKPIITSFSPASGPAGLVVSITGYNLTGATAVIFNGTAATNFSVVNAASIAATIPTGATTGTITVITPGGTATSATSLIVIPMPTITSFTPTIGQMGMVVTLTGTNFTGASAVGFNGAAATTFNVLSATSITATVPAGATTGPVTVTTIEGTATSAVIFVIGTTSINPIDNAEMIWVPGGSFTMGTNISPTWDSPTTQQVTLTGYWLYKFDVTVAQYKVFCSATGRNMPAWPSEGYTWAGKTSWDDPALQQHPIVNVTWLDAKAYADWAGVKLPTEAQWEYAATGKLGKNYPWGGQANDNDLYNGWDDTKSANYFNSFSKGISTWPVGSFPTGGSWCGAQDMAGNVWQWCADWYGNYSATPVNDPIGPATGAGYVQRGGSWVNGSFAYNDCHRSSYRSEAKPDEIRNDIGFRCVTILPPVIMLPTFTSFTPTNGPAGTVVTLTGTNFTGATAVKFNGTTTPFTVASANSITTTVPVGATTGKITITTLGGTATSTTNFTVIPIPTISSFTPASGPVVNAVVTLTGTNFTGATAVKFNGTAATTFNVVSATSITATVPVGATTGNITVTTPIGTATSAASFIIILVPTITSFTPARGPVGTVVTVTGTNLTDVTAVKFNGTAATTFSVVSATSITATVPTGATTGAITVATPYISATSTVNFFVDINSINQIDSAEMVWVPGGTFTMGTDVNFAPWTPAIQRVTLSGYWIYKNDVTVAQYRVFCSATGHASPSFPSGYSWAGKSGWDDAALQQHPIVDVSWNDAKAYADWAGVTLPTEAQYEYASRGPQGNNYPWGGTATVDDPNNGWDNTKCANYYNSQAVGKSTWPVGSFPAGASWCGAQDMAGNVWQWCGDWYGNYSATPVTNPSGPATGIYCVYRGGSWNNTRGDFLRGVYRNSVVPGYSGYSFGFRCASTTPGP